MARPSKGAEDYILVLKCPDRKGVVAAVSGFLADNDASIVESNQLIAHRFAMSWSLHPAAKPRVLIAVSKFGHCLYDLLHQWRSGLLPVEVVGVVSNHDAMRSFVEWNDLPFHFLPMTKDGKAEQEAQILALVDSLHVDLLVLARYMQILSPQMCERLAGRCINIHHSFLPSFKGAKPYHQAFERGVQRVDHGHMPDDLVKIGQDIECAVLARAVAWHAERRILINGVKTVVFGR
jgi:formyltetrahydrofolate deformylase